jgi:hypothetical protein
MAQGCFEGFNISLLYSLCHSDNVCFEGFNISLVYSLCHNDNVCFEGFNISLLYSLCHSNNVCFEGFNISLLYSLCHSNNVCSKQTLSLWHREYNSDMLKPSKQTLLLWHRLCHSDNVCLDLQNCWYSIFINDLYSFSLIFTQDNIYYQVTIITMAQGVHSDMLKPSKQTLLLWHREYNSDMLKPSKQTCRHYHYDTGSTNSDMLKQCLFWRFQHITIVLPVS